MVLSHLPKQYRSKEVCQLLGLSKKTLYYLEARGFIPPVVRDWRGWRIYDESHLEAIKEYKASKAKGHNLERRNGSA